MINDTEKSLTANGMTLVLGATGKTGRRIVKRLQARHIPVRIGSRTAAPPFNWEDTSTWSDALEGATSVYVAFSPDIAAPGALEAISAFTAQALDLGTRRLVLLSGCGEAEAQWAEQILKASGAAWTIVRCRWFMQNFKDGHVGYLYELTGSRLLTFDQAIAQTAQTSGQNLHFKSASMEAFTQVLREPGQLDEIVRFLRYLFSEVLDGRNAHLSNGAERALGGQPRDFTEFAC